MKVSEEGDSANVSSSRSDLIRITVAGLIGILLVANLALDLFGSDHSAAHSSGRTGEAVTLTEYELISRAGTIEPTAYWVGPRPGTDRFEVEADPEGNLYVRYQPGGSTTGNDRADSLTVATYPVAEAHRALEAAAGSDGEGLSHGDGFIALGSNDSHGAYVVFDNQPEVQLEIYSPVPGEAMELVNAGALMPVHWTPLG